MTTFIELKPERPPGPPCDQAEADSHRRAECEERIIRLLSALGGGTSLYPTKNLDMPKAVFQETLPNPDSETSVQFLLLDRTGPIAEFGSWDDARRYMTRLQFSGASIIRLKKKPLEPGAAETVD
jgi:hypothetical protein